MLKQNILNCASNFQEAFGTGCMAVDATARALWNVAPFCASCGYARCDYTAAHLDGAAEALRKGYASYRCPIGLAFVAAPVERGRLALVAGPFVAGDSEGAVGAHLSEQLKARIGRLPQLTAARAGAIAEILAASSAGLERVQPPHRDMGQTARTDVVRKAKEYISSNYKQKFTLDDVARHVYLSRSYLSGVFKAETGKTLSSYINEVRIEKSKALLCETPLSLLDIALLCGFEDQSYFSKVFKAMEGIAPKDYRTLSFRFGWPES